MVKSLKIKENFYLVIQKISNAVRNILVRKPSNKILIFDESGSMSGIYHRMIQDIIKQVFLMADGDILNLGCFSSKGQYKWILKGIVLNEQTKQQVKQTLESHNPWYNMTCFADIIGDVENLINDVKAFSDNFSLLFFTDGEDNQDREKVIQVLKKVSPQLSFSTVIGYGHWYNRNRLATIAQEIGAALVHADNLEQFNQYFSDFNNQSGSAEQKTSVKLKSNPLFDVAYTLTNNTVEVVKVEDEVLISPSASNIYYFSNKPVGEVVSVSETPYFEEVYGGTKTLLQSDKVNESLDLIGAFGDVAFAEEIASAFTLRERGGVENKLTEAVYNNKLRLRKGVQINCVPDPNAFCVLDLLKILMVDDSIKLALKHPALEYNTIGRKKEYEEGYPKFEINSDVEVNMNNLVFNEKLLNISIGTKVPGKVRLGNDAKEHDLDQLFDTFQFKTYTIVYDGKLNVPKLPLTDVSPELMELFKLHKLIESANGTVVIDLTRLPLINRAMATQYDDFDVVCDHLWTEKLLEVENYVFGSIYKSFPEELREKVADLVRPTKFTETQVEYLSKYGVQKDGSFKVPSKDLPSTDVLYVTSIEFGIDKINSIPKLPDVLKNVANGKKLTPAQQLVKDAYDKYELQTKEQTDAQKALYLKTQIDQNRKDLFQLRNLINEVRFAWTIAKGKPRQLAVLEEHNEHTYQGKLFTLDINRNVEVKI